MIQTESTREPLEQWVFDVAQPLYRFCELMLGPEVNTAELVADIYWRFSRQAHRHARHKHTADELKVQLFQTALAIISKEERNFPRFYRVGRDVRQTKALETNLLSLWRSQTDSLNVPSIPLGDRLRLLDTDLRAPVILRDHLGFEEESILQILGLRWGVFRHRLHRGRIELQKFLQGYSTKVKRN